MDVTGAIADVRLVRLRPFLAAAAVSVATVVLLFTWLLAAAVVVGISGCLLAFTARTHRAAFLASSITSTGLGLAVGPVLYLCLWALVSVTS